MYQILDYLTIYKKPWNDLTDDEKKLFNVFFIHRLLSFSNDLIELVNYVQIHSNIPKEIEYNIWLNILPNKKLYFNYIKKSKKKNNNETLVSFLSEFFQVSTKEIIEYLPLVPKKDLELLLSNNGFDKKSIKKLLK